MAPSDVLLPWPLMAEIKMQGIEKREDANINVETWELMHGGDEAMKLLP